MTKCPNVDGVVVLNHNYGCGVAITAPAAIVPKANACMTLFIRA